MSTTSTAFPQTTADGRARAAALTAAAALDAQPAAIVGFESKGAVVIIGPQVRVLAAAARLASKNALQCTVVVTDSAAPPEPASAPGIAVVHEKPIQITGHLGQFSIIIAAPPPLGGINLLQKLGRSGGLFDLVLDLSTPPFLTQEMRPFGYYAPADDAALEKALAELPDMVGEFEKPKFFNYDPEICAHGASGLTGCTRCLDACPASAIISMGEEIAVDPYLCQGGGACATACPTGAITYVYPRLGDSLSKLGTLLKTYRAGGGMQPIVLFHDAEAGKTYVEGMAARLPENVIPVEIAEIGAVGMDIWLSVLAYGAGEVALLTTATTPQSVRAVMEAQITYTRAILAGMGYPEDCLRTYSADGSLMEALGRRPAAFAIAPANFAGMDDKRTTLRLAVEHLYGKAPHPRAEVALPEGAPFGEIRVDRNGCTLCMACVSVCPAGALADGGDVPQLNFIEANCVQCGLCASACPEDVIGLHPRYLYDPEKRRASRVLNEETPFHCIRCGKPFATQKMMDKMSDTLKDHWMFKTPEALQRVRMCGDCRVRDVLQASTKHPDGGLGL